MDYFLTEEQQMIVDTARQITEERIVPHRAELDEKHEFPRAIRITSYNVCYTKLLRLADGRKHVFAQGRI